MQEIIKAAEQYYLDNGKLLPQVAAGEVTLSTGDLLVNRENLSTWKGPYISSLTYVNQRNSSYSIGKYDLTFQMDLRIIDSKLSDDYCILGSSDCYMWLELHCTGSEEIVATCKPIFSKIDEIVDGGDGDEKGKLRALRASSTAHYYLIKGLPAKKII